MRTVRRTCTILITLALSVAPAVTAAQSDDADAASVPVHSTGTEGPSGMWTVPGATVESFPWGVRNTVGFSLWTESTDPRLTGDLDCVFTFDEVRRSATGRGTGVARLVNEGGSWLGPLFVTYYPDGSEFRYSTMEGSGGYEGLTATMTNYIGAGQDSQPQLIIWADDPPPVPDAGLLPD